MEEPEKPSVTASPSTEPSADRADVILTPDQRVRVFISSTLGELAEERAPDSYDTGTRCRGWRR